MFKKNLIVQDGYKDCGPTSLLMLIKYYKGNINIEKLKEMCKSDKTGTTAYDLIAAAKECGFEANGVKCKLEDLTINNLILPCIAHVIINGSYNHYVVIYKVDFKRKKLLVADSATGYKKYTFASFNEIYNEVLILLYPAKNILCEEDLGITSFLKNIIYSSKRELKQTVAISFFITLFSITTSFYMQYMVDNINSDKRTLILGFLLFLLLYSLKMISDFFRNQILILINQKVDLELIFGSFKKIIFLPYLYYRNHTTGEIMSRITDLSAVREVISRVAISIFIDLPLTVISLIVLYFISPNLFFISLIILMCYIFITLIFSRPLNKMIDACQKASAEANSYLVESVTGFESVKGNNIEEDVIAKFETKQVGFLRKICKLDNYYNIQNLLKEIINNYGFLTIILLGSILVIEGTLTLGQLLSFNALLIYFLNPIRNIIDLDANIKQAKNAIKRILNLLQIESSNGVFDRGMEGEIKITNLSYSFGKNQVLSDINVKLKKNVKVAVIGKSGGGKSTLFKILKKYYPISRGSITVNHIDINDYKESDVVYISQNEILFTDTIKNNVGRIDNNIADICCLEEIINNNQLGYNMLIEENGFNISGGEKQRIVLARSLSKDFSILVIDEGLSQVDTNMERRILKKLLKHFSNKTIIFISHRLDNIDLFGQVIEIEGGKLIKNVKRNNR